MKVSFSIPIENIKDNCNGRVYSQEAIEKAVADYQIVIKEKKSFGGLYPPTFPLSLTNISHVVKELKVEDDSIVGEMATLTSRGFKEQGVISTSGDLVTDMLNNSASYSFKPLIVNGRIVSFDIFFEK